MKKSLLISILSIFCCWMGVAEAFALDQKDGVYQIGNAQDLEDFSNLVASGNGGINAVLTTDIDMTGVSHQPIGTVGSPFKGTFDGQQHFIRNMVIDLPDQEYVGLFGVLNDGAYIKNVVVDNGSSVSGKCFVGAIAGGTNGGGSVTFENCGNEGSVGAQAQNAAGICGVSMNSACGIKIIHCFNSGGITGSNESAAFCGWVGDNGSEITNCYNSGFIIGMDGNNSMWRNGRGKGTNNYDSYGYQGTKISEDEYELSSGSVAYQLNGNQSENVAWYQTLGEDMHPLPFSSHGIVYAVGDLYCDGQSKGGDAVFSNTNESNRDPHAFVNGICSRCGEVDKEYLPLTDGFYTLSTAVDLNWFAALVNKGNKKVNARLGADIDFSEYTKNDVMIGGDMFSANEGDESKAFEGVFDGQGHTITVNYNVSYDGVALFKVVTNSTIKNLVVDGAIESTQKFIGGLGFVSRGTCNYENIIVAVNITGSYPGDATHGGLFAVCHESPTFTNCAFTGTMNAPDCEGSAAIIGYAHVRVETLLQNCYVSASLLSLRGNSTVFARNVANMVNCYYTDNITELSESAATVVPTSALASGELCYKLNDGGANGAWRQTLGSDNYPVPFDSHSMVYANGSMRCDGTMGDDISYSNTEGAAQRDEHKYVDDICSVCGARVIRNGSQLKALADAINNAEIDGNVIVDLANDIDMTGISFEGIGTRIDDNKLPFKGTFDGHGYRIKNMIIETEGGNKGLFGLVSGATIKNVIVDKSCEIYSKGYSAGIAGTAVGKAVVTFENCGNEATVNVGQSGANGAGILGVNDMSEAYVKIINCFNTGDIVGERECGAISGWLGDRAEVINCYNSGEVVGVDGNRTFVRYNGSNVALTNCYEVNGNQVTTVEKEDVASGKLCYDLNQGAGETIYYQTLGSDDHPIFDATHKVVVKEGDTYVNDSSTGISTTVKPAEGPAAVYSLSGVRQQQLGRGVNIVRKADGNVVKVIVK
ncbi:MAG: hypothetical protein J6I61_12895 [Prevotella sp.]|nr:hypothetical protein [Prevotella sp.]